MEELFNYLKEVGFNTYESKVYLALLQYGNSTGYEVSKNSGVPQARAYDTLKTLESKKVVISTGDKPATYMPVDPKEILKRYENRYNTSMSYLKENLLNFSGNCVEPIINIKDRKSIAENIKRILKNAQKEILLEAWGDDFETYKELIREAYNRGVDVKIVGYKEFSHDFGLFYEHEGADYLEKTIGKCFILAVDDEEALISINNEEQAVIDAVCTKNNPLVFIIKEMMIHDMFILDIKKNLGLKLDEIYGENLIKLREKLLGKDFRLKTH